MAGEGIDCCLCGEQLLSPAFGDLHQDFREWNQLSGILFNIALLRRPYRAGLGLVQLVLFTQRGSGQPKSSACRSRGLLP